MKVWVVKTSEMIPGDANRGRLLRSGLIAHLLDSRGHEVTWWMSTFDHANRRQRSSGDTEATFGRRGRIRMIRSPGYKRSISAQRIIDHLVWGRRFSRSARTETVPDLIVCSYPTIESAWICAEFGAHHGIPVILDLRDMWPDIFSTALGRFGQPVLRGLLAPFEFLARRAMTRATGLFSISDEMLAWALKKARRPRSPLDAVFPLAYPEPEKTPGNEYDSFWDSHGVTRDGAFTVVYVGTLSRRSCDMDPILAAASELAASSTLVRFVLCGTGDDLERLRRLTANCPNVILPGWMSTPQIRSLLARSHLGLVPYRNAMDLCNLVPNKAAEYLSAGVPIATSLTGALARVVRENDCGFSYDSRSPVELANNIRSLIAAPAAHSAMGVRARALYERDYRAEDVYGRYVERLEEIAQAHDEIATSSTRALLADSPLQHAIQPSESPRQ